MKMRKGYIAVLLPIIVLLASVVGSCPSKAQAQEEKPQASKTQEEKAQPAAEPRDWVRKIFEIKYADPLQLSDLLRIFGGSIRPNQQLKVISVSGPAGVVAAVEDAIKRFDVPPPAAKNIELVAYLLVALDQPISTPGVPPELQGIINQLKGVFAYQGYRLLETLVVRGRDGEGGSVTGIVPTSPTETLKTFYSFRFRSVNITSDDKGRVIRVNELSLGARVPIGTTVGEKGTQIQYQNTGVNTDIDVREGQKVVVGKANIDGSNNALILVVTAKVVE
jgi:hypothetical protein